MRQITRNIASAETYNNDITNLTANLEQIFAGEKKDADVYKLILADIQLILNNISELKNPQNEPNMQLDLDELKDIHDSTNKNKEEIERLYENILVNTLNYELLELHKRLDEILRIEGIFTKLNNYFIWLDDGAKNYRALRENIDVLINKYRNTQYFEKIKEFHDIFDIQYRAFNTKMLDRQNVKFDHSTAISRSTIDYRDFADNYVALINDA
jgi:hypothetical protein